MGRCSGFVPYFLTFCILKRRSIRSHWLATGYGLHQKTSLVSIRPHSLAHTGNSSTQRPALPSRPSIRSFTWWGLEMTSWSSSRSLDRPTPQQHWICSCQPLETDRQTDRPFYVAMVERCDGPSWLRDDDDDETLCSFRHHSKTHYFQFQSAYPAP